ncbi:hypothetical protein M413DRAFT_72866 [Hebeloma cylindrosporum]|uniref:Man(5)GlcNAc(2)-PP-dolichol translocation protein RFT1 n=1 Tax=Hebeloma cylindrosporum TaxID=76867 RepID=A0A0C2YI18_HEBCY|nr:hypothetical protein M413DRAFT_72866 [Hebeloma cylindrosporum h7]
MATTTSSPASRLFATSVASASSLMVLQLLSRLFTFALNQALFRLASPSAFGAAAIQFELILSTILFLSREGVRNALLRVGQDVSADARIRRMNLSFLPIGLGIPLALATSVAYARYASGEMKRQPYFEEAILIYAVAAVAELLSEPLYNVAMVDLKTNVRVRAEGLGITAKSILTFLILLYDSRAGTGDFALVAFAVGQMAYSIVMFLTYTVSFGWVYVCLHVFANPNLRYLNRNAAGGYFDTEIMQLSFTMTLQSLVKHFLTEGDKMILSSFSPLRDQGGYALAVNYGSLIARIVFQPIEETLRVFFSRILGGTAQKKASGSRRASLAQSAAMLQSLLSIQLSLSVILVIFGSASLPILLPLLLPKQYLSTSAPQVLGAWIWYIPVLAVNGGLEAFLSSVATPKDLNNQSRWMIGFSAIYIGSAISFYALGLGDASLVYANIVNLSARIVYSLRYATNFFNEPKATVFRWQDTLPSRTLCVVSGLSAVIIQLSQRRLKADEIASELGKRALLNPSVLIHVGVCGLLALVCLGTWWRASGRYLRFSSFRRDKVE